MLPYKKKSCVIQKCFKMKILYFVNYYYYLLSPSWREPPCRGKGTQIDTSVSALRYFQFLLLYLFITFPYRCCCYCYLPHYLLVYLSPFLGSFLTHSLPWSWELSHCTYRISPHPTWSCYDNHPTPGNLPPCCPNAKAIILPLPFITLPINLNNIFWNFTLYLCLMLESLEMNKLSKRYCRQFLLVKYILEELQYCLLPHCGI